MTDVPVRGLTIRQPFASLMAMGAKRIETRGWSTGYRGWVLIHAGKGQTKLERDLVQLWPFGDYLHPEIAQHGPLPLGAIVAAGELFRVRTTDELIRSHPWGGTNTPRHERDFGHYAPGRYGWLFRDVRRLRTPVPVAGAQGLWIPTPEVVDQVREQLRAVSSHGIVLDSEGIRCEGCAALTANGYCAACRAEGLHLCD